MRREGETGVQTHVRSAFDWLQGTGRAAQLVTPFDAPAWLVYPVFGIRRLLDKLSKPASVWWYRHWHRVFLCHAMRKRLADGRPCVVYAQCPLSARAALAARVSLAQRVIMIVHFNLSQADEWADKGAIRAGGRLYRAIHSDEAMVLPALDAIVCVSDFMRQKLLERIPAIDRARLRVIPNFLADPGETTIERTRNDLIMIGTLEPRKNQRYAIEIVHAASRLGCRLRLTVVGGGPDLAMLTQLARALGVDHLIDFMGYVANAAALIPGHRACLHVARMENLPMTVIEAQSRGLPIFAPAVGGIPEMFDDGVEGRLIPLDDPDVAARRIVEWLEDPERMRRAGRAARQKFLARFEAGRAAAELARFLDEVAA